MGKILRFRVTWFAMELPRLDILLYAHDGRGLGHASRTIAIGMALRRIAPQLRVLFVSGCKTSQELIGRVPLDWLKLPAYETEVIAGKSCGVTGNSLFTDRELGALRGLQLAQIVKLYRPRLVLADHTPQGKHRELVPALTMSAHTGTRWLLGVRGVVGDVHQAGSELARRVFREHYQDMFWYGDSLVLGHDHQALLRSQYGVEPWECGYVSRLKELTYWQGDSTEHGLTVAGTISVPWLGEHSFVFLRALAEALRLLGPGHGDWHLFIEPGTSPAASAELIALFGPLKYCRLEPLSGPRYIHSLSHSRSAVIYGGYNSIMDVLAMSLPAVVVLRTMRDNEQQQHLDHLLGVAGELLSVVEETRTTPEQLAGMLGAGLEKRTTCCHAINLDGAHRAAGKLVRLLGDGSAS